MLWRFRVEAKRSLVLHFTAWLPWLVLAGCMGSVGSQISGMDAGTDTETSTDTDSTTDTDTGPEVVWTDAGPRRGASYFFIGDGQCPRPDLFHNLRTMYEVDPEAAACFHAGDLTSTATEEQWRYHMRSLVDAAPDPSVPPSLGGIPRESHFRSNVDSFGDYIRYFGAVGNHDVMSADWYTLWNTFLPGQIDLGVNEAAYGMYYAVVHGKTLFIVLDSVHNVEGQAQWLEFMLPEAEQQGIRWKVAIFHYPVYPCDNKSPFSRGLLWVELFEKYGVDVVFNGHSHLYERTCPMRNGMCADGGVVYVNSSGGGALLRDPLPEKVDTVTWGERSDEYSCEKILERYEKVHHFCHLMVDEDAGVADLSCYESHEHEGDAAPQPFDTYRFEKH